MDKTFIGNNGITAYVRPVENFLRRLYYRSKNDPKATFTGLYKALSWPKLIEYAALKVLENQGHTAGTDKITKGIFLRTFNKQIEKIIKEIKLGSSPLAVLRVYIPKPGKTEKRPLGIPVLRDRVKQEAIRMILEVIYEPTFKRNSVGFRRGFSTQDALKDCWCYVQPVKKMQYVLEFDIRKFFDNVDHEILYHILGEKIHDLSTRQKTLGTIKNKMLQAISKKTIGFTPMAFNTDVLNKIHEISGSSQNRKPKDLQKEGKSRLLQINWKKSYEVKTQISLKKPGRLNLARLFLLYFAWW